MKKRKLILAVIAGVLFLGTGCGSNKKEDKTSALQEWTESLADSIAYVKSEIDSCQNNLDIMHDRVNEWLRDFVYVNNSREVEGYTIFHGWEKRYPLKTTGLMARITENEQLELIAAFEGAPFTSITVIAGENTASTGEVLPDQGLNYRRGNLSTVMFNGPKADSVAKLIADNELNPVTVVFNGKTAVGKYRLPDENAKMISYTWLLYDARRQANILEARIPMLNEKIKILRATMEKNGKKAEE